jgi:Putative zinc-finger
MTLPFRRRHHDDEASHDRAHALVSASFLGPLADADQAWLDLHLGACPECRADQEGYLADRAMLQSLRQAPPTPPRDLWARTAAAIEREAGTRQRRSLLERALGPLPRGVPVAPLAGVLVAALVLVVALMPPGATPTQPGSGTQPAIAAGSSGPQATGIKVDNQVAWLQPDASGHYALVFADVDQVCPTGDQGCAALPIGSPAHVELPAKPKAVVLSPGSQQVAVVNSDGTITIVDVPTPAPSQGTTSVPPLASFTAAATAAPSLPAESAAGSPLPSASIGIPNSRPILTGAVVVGTPAYDATGAWFAFSARPLDKSAGPDLYAWHVGDPVAQQLTHDGRTYFSGWFGDRIAASSIEDQQAADGSPAPDASPVASDAGAPSTSAAPASTHPGSQVAPSSRPTATGSGGESGASGTPDSSPGGPSAAPSPIEVHPYSLLVDPATAETTPFARPDVWLPSIDPKGRFVAYWSGTLTANPSGDGWQPATGALVLDGWSKPIPTAAPSVLPSDSPATGSSQQPPTTVPTAPPAVGLGTPEVPASVGPVPSVAIADGPAGTGMVLAAGPITDFDLRFDPTGTRLAVWTADPGVTDIGPLRLLVLDPATGAVEPAVQALPSSGVVAMRGFSLDDGRLGWVTPPGQNGQSSSIQVLAWKGDAFGTVQTVPGGNPQIVR